MRCTFPTPWGTRCSSPAVFEAADDTPACALHAMLSFRTREEQAKILEVMCRNSKADGMKGIIVDPEDLEPKK